MSNYLDNIYIIKEDIIWDKEAEDTIVVYIKNRGFFNFVAQKIFQKPEISKIYLDRFGSFVWLLIDGNRTILEIAKIIKLYFGEEIEPLYERLSKFFYILEELKFITLKREAWRC